MNMVKKKQHARTILQRLKENYPAAHCTLDHRDPFELLVATVLSAQCTDERVNKVTPRLFKQFPTATQMAAADIEKIEELIRSTGFYHQKAKSLKYSSMYIRDKFDGKVPSEMDQLIQLPGIGRKTANVILGTAFRKEAGVVVDTHVKRISRRLGLTAEQTPEKIESDLVKILHRDDWTIYSHLIIQHGREICKARKPICTSCFLNDICPAANGME